MSIDRLMEALGQSMVRELSSGRSDTRLIFYFEEIGFSWNIFQQMFKIFVYIYCYNS